MTIGGVAGLRTRLCAELAIDYPIFSVGFGMGAVPELAAAVSNAGGFGVVGTSEVEPDEIRRLIARTRALTDRPFGVNFIIADDGSPEDQAIVQAGVRAAITERVAAIVLFWGDPAPHVPHANASGVKVFLQMGSVEEGPMPPSEAGVDVVISQGIEAGGHVRGTMPI